MSDDLPVRIARAHAALRTAAVTGTNGKTTTTSMIEAIVAASGEPHARLTTIGAFVNGERVHAPSEAEEFVVTIERAVALGVRTLALEVTSKALAYGFAARFAPNVSVFTNLTRDHLEAHGSPEAYLASKAQLFMALAPGGVAVLNADDAASALIDEVIRPAVTRRWYSTRGAVADLVATRISARLDGTDVTLARSRLADTLEGTLTLRAPGAVHVENALAAALGADALGYDARAIHQGLREFSGVPGRFEVVRSAPTVVVDYAHTPDGLEGTLRTARALVADGARLVCVFGCGGGRDRGKRPEMGAIAERLADHVVLTTDNPRFESPAAIVAEIRAGMRAGARVEVELDRRVAIEESIRTAGVHDLIVIAGKGHEATQELAGARVPFSDVEVAANAVR